jgi:protein tyrosine phosphatase (PTP) superfamily phosphohydrolase (DUF442 family)
MYRRSITFGLSGLILLGGVWGCCPNNYRSGYVYPPRAGTPPYNPLAVNGPMPPRYVPNGQAGVAAPPPGAVVVPPNGIAPPAQAVPPPPGQAAPPPGSEIQQNRYLPSNPPAPSSSSGLAPTVYLEQPQPTAPQAKPMPNDAAAPQTPEPPPARDDRSASPDLPVDIPQFATVKTDIASGQEPSADGIAWLKRHGYRGVLYVRASGADDAAARKQYEQAGLRYRSLELSPQKLTKEIVDQFNRFVADNDNRPLFVYDKDGSLAGALWYLHFRLVDGATPEKAREEAERLGFKPERGEAYVQMWLAVQKLLNEVKP